MHTSSLEKLIASNLRITYAIVTWVTLAIIAVYFLPALLRMDLYTDDMRQHISWYYSYRDPELFQHDLLKTFYADTFLVVGFKSLYSLGSRIIDPQVLGELLAVALALVTAVLAYAIGKNVTNGSQLGGIANVLLFLFGSVVNINYMIPLAGGLQRSFALPILLLGILSLLGQNFVALSLALLLAALFYPPSFISLCIYSSLIIGVHFFNTKKIPKGIYLLLAVVTVCFSLLIWMQRHSSHEASVWTPYSLREALNMVEFKADGLIPILFSNWWLYISHALPALGIPLTLFLSSCLLMYFLPRGLTIFRLEASTIIMSAWINYAFAYLLFFRLYEPNRYVLYPFLAFWLLVFPPLFLKLVEFLDKLYYQRNKYLIISRKQVLTILFVLVLGVTLSSTILVSIRVVKGQGGMIGTVPTELYNFVKLLPKNTLIAAHPRDADDIPMRSQRSVLVMEKSFYPSHKEFYEEIKARAFSIWAAMYATDPQPILHLQQKYGVDVFLVNRQMYKEDPMQAKPFISMIKSLQSSLGERQPLLLSPPKEAVLYAKGDFSLVDLKKLITHS
ncbi:hypothetical protein [Iningainema tapete]|uniref:Uncharacterized protein n=1 Tax=Iningainema tapete BLCC-T55 TaxID=2748662 RepID=A0A8J6XH09_9CYAN|nr:hypothetical protein [Iningainema tapete]MBD2772392.1 hypothetical protein [Iningainema tapete BLCC-T55]